MCMKKPTDIKPIQTDLPPDGYGQWNSEPPDTYTGWGDYFADVAQLALELYNRGNAESSEVFDRSVITHRFSLGSL